jgi:hypothetical protein
MSVERTVMWNRLDVTGMDACQFRSRSDGWSIAETAISIADGSVARLSYEVTCFSDWSARTASVSGWIRDREISLSLERTVAALWHVNGAPIEGTSALVDIDLGFTPATNTNAIRRLDLRLGENIETTALWLDASDWTLKPLRQTYRRKSEKVFAYASPLHDYSADITVDSFGVLQDYPGLWTVVKTEVCSSPTQVIRRCAGSCQASRL